MHPKLRAFLLANGLRADATEQQAWEYYKQLQNDGVAYNGEERAEAPAPPAAAVPPPAPAADPAAIERAIQADRERTAAIEDVCGRAGMPVAEIRALVLSGASIDQARQKAFDHITANSPPIGAGAGRGEVGVEAIDKLRAASLDGMLMRCGRAPEKPADGARDFRGMRLLDIAREHLELSGVRTRGMDPRAIAGRALVSASSSDFPALLGALVNKTLLGAYAETPATWRPFVARSDANDFKTKYAIKLSGSADLADKRENGEFQTAEFKDSKEAYAVSTKGRIIRITREMLINDDLGGFTRISIAFGSAARRRENSAVYGLLTANGAMSDGVALFHADHKNLLGAAALGSDALAVGRATMRRQTGMAGEAIDVRPAFLLTGPELETNADILLRSTALPTGTFSAGVINPHAGKLTPISDGLISDTNAWYLLADPNQYPVIEVAWLMGEESPYIEEEPIPLSGGDVGILVRSDFGCGVVDYVGAAYNPGA